MADVLAMRHGPLGALARTGESCTVVEVAVAPLSAKLSLRCRPNLASAAGRSFGVVPPNTACRAAVSEDRAALWLGPDEWLLFAQDGDAATIVSQLSVVLAGTHHSLVDVSHRSAGFFVKGSQAATLINHGCPLDLAHEAFPIGMCTRTLFAKAGILLWRVEAHRYHVEIERSFAPYVWNMLIKASEEFA